MSSTGAMHSRASQQTVSYELHIMRNGDWKVDSVYDEKDLAVDVGRRLIETRRTTAVRVLEETFTENNEIKTRTVFRRSVADESNREAIERQARAAREAREARLQRAVQTRQREAVAKTKRTERHSNGWLLAKLIGIGLTGIGMLIFFGHLIYG